MWVSFCSSLWSFHLPRNIQVLCSWHFILHHCFTLSYIYLPILLALYFAFSRRHAILFTDIFQRCQYQSHRTLCDDGLQGSSILSTPSFTLIIYTYVNTQYTVCIAWAQQNCLVKIYYLHTVWTYICMYICKYAKQKHLGCKKGEKQQLSDYEYIAMYTCD